MPENNEGGVRVQREVRPTAWLAITYLIYIVFFEGLVWGGCAYMVVWRGFSGWWFAFALVASSAAYGPQKWRSLFDGKSV